MTSLSNEDSERAKKSYNVYDVLGTESMDAFFVADGLRSLGLNPTEEFALSLGGCSTKEEKTLTQAEFLEIYARAQKEIYNGTTEDFVGVLELYDRRGKGKIGVVDLSYILQNMGEKLPKVDVDYIIRICCPKEDSYGEVSYSRFLTKLMNMETKTNPYASTYTPAAEIVAARQAERAEENAKKAEEAKRQKEALKELQRAEKKAAKGGPRAAVASPPPAAESAE